jgi:hypothetical protein
LENELPEEINNICDNFSNPNFLSLPRLNSDLKKDDLDIYAALENDFVSVLPDGKFFLLPNLSPLVKGRHLTEKVRIHGKQDSSNIWINTLEMKQNGGYKNAWNRKRQEAGDVRYCAVKYL